MVLDYILKNLINLWIVLLNNLLCTLDRLRLTTLLKLMYDEWLKQLNRHRFRKPTLVEFKLRSNYDD